MRTPASFRIAIDYRSALGERPAGIGQSVRSLVGAIAELRTGADVTLLVDTAVVPGALPFAARTGPVRTASALATAPWHLWAARLARSDAFDIYLSTGSAIVPCMAPGRTVLLVYDLAAQRRPSDHPRRVRWLSRGLLARAVRSAVRCVTISEFTRDEMTAVLGVARDVVDVAPLGLHPARAVPADAVREREVRARLGLPSRYVLAVNTIEPRKNVAGLLRAFALLGQRRRDGLRLVVVGQEGWLSDGVAADVRSLGIEGEVVFTGFVADEDLPAIYRGADVFCYPSHYEGFGLPVLESMSLGTPVVTSSVSSMPEVAGGAALLADPTQPAEIAAALERVLSDPAEAERLRAAGRVRAATFTWRRCAERVMESLTKAAASRRR